jgi:hypothetical protein
LTALLAAVLQKTSGYLVDVFANEALFGRLDIQDVEWRRYADGTANMSGLRMRPRDLAKIGQLVLNGGVWNNAQIVSKAWIDESTSPHVNGESLFFSAAALGWKPLRLRLSTTFRFAPRLETRLPKQRGPWAGVASKAQASVLTWHPFSAHWGADRGIAMNRFGRSFAFALMLATAGLAGCSGASGILTGSTAAADEPGSLSNEDPTARPIAVAWTSARAQRCGFYFDPTKLRASYLAFEAKKSAPDQLAKAEKTYDSTFKTIRERVAADPEYCSDKKSADIKKDLTRHLAGDFAPNFPNAKVAETCWLLCGGEEKAWSPDRFWAEQNARNSGR